MKCVASIMDWRGLPLDNVISPCPAILFPTAARTSHALRPVWSHRSFRVEVLPRRHDLRWCHDACGCSHWAPVAAGDERHRRPGPQCRHQLHRYSGRLRRRRLTRCASLQAYYSIAGRDIEHELVPAVMDAQIGLLCWSPLAGGLLSGKFDRHGHTDNTARRASIAFPPVDETRVHDIIDTLKTVAARHDATAAQIALAWLLSRPAVTSVIVGIKRPEQLTENLGALELTLSSEDLAELDQVSRPAAAYPGWIKRYNARSRVPAGHAFEGPSWSLGERPL
ncbi:aldo/keto reductase [Xanthomonas campestris pv. lawsoniae]|nr:aldo/keto reductase [Xanthomonas campestris pv. lawsoniae]